MASNLENDRVFRIGERIIGRRPEGDPVIRLEIYGIVILAFAIALMLALLSFDPSDVTAVGGTRQQPAFNVIGPIGAHVADLFLSAIGLAAFALTAVITFLGYCYLVGRHVGVGKPDVLGWLGLLLGGVVCLHIAMAPSKILGHLPGGLAGEYAAEVGRALLSTTGTMLLAATVMVCSVIAITHRSFFELVSLGGRLSLKTWASMVALLKYGDEEEVDAEIEYEATEISPEDIVAEELIISGPSVGMTPPEFKPPSGGVPASELSPPPELPADVPPRPARKVPTTVDFGDSVGHAEEVESDGDSKSDSDSESDTATDAEDHTLRIVESAAMRRSRDLVVGEQMAFEGDEEDKEFELPSLTLLDYHPPSGQAYDRAVLKQNAEILEAKLADYRVQGKVVEIHPGPVITMYEFKPAAGVKISSIANLADDLAMALSALKIRIVAPIPGKNVVGIEVPNASREMVWLKEILSDGSYKTATTPLTLVLGKDIVGNPMVMNLAKAPHLLVAGATGAGKSVAINSFICSLLYRASPDDVRMIMVDPKMLELSMYDGIPHLLLPVVTDPKLASVALRWAVREMTRRYALMADFGVRNLSSYNTKVAKLLEADEPELPTKLVAARLKRKAQGIEEPEGVILDAKGDVLKKMPLVVVVVDELADLMMVAGKDVEQSIARLAQMARASGIHLILATQRPSVDVITGLIKANFPSRISFRVASKIDSRTILDQKGAESLLGMGDMLWLSPGTSAPTRVHGCFVSDEEVHRIVAHLHQQGEADYDLDILTESEAEEGSATDGLSDEDYDSLHDEAVRLVAETRNASISFLQRKLKVGYNRAARIVERLELDGVVGASDGTSRPREVFIDPL